MLWCQMASQWGVNQPTGDTKWNLAFRTPSGWCALQGWGVQIYPARLKTCTELSGVWQLIAAHLITQLWIEARNCRRHLISLSWASTTEQWHKNTDYSWSYSTRSLFLMLNDWRKKMWRCIFFNLSVSQRGRARIGG